VHITHPSSFIQSNPSYRLAMILIFKLAICDFRAYFDCYICVNFSLFIGSEIAVVMKRKQNKISNANFCKLVLLREEFITLMR
jgi:hypothetical protein